MMNDVMRMGSNLGYLASWDLEELPGQEITVQIDRIVKEEIASNGATESRAVAYFTNENIKPMILNKPNSITLCRLYQTREAGELKGKRVIIGVDKVKDVVGTCDALRIRPRVPEEDGGAVNRCEDCGDELAPVGRMTRMQLATYTRRKYGKCLCAMCASKAVRGPVCD